MSSGNVSPATRQGGRQKAEELAAGLSDCQMGCVLFGSFFECPPSSTGQIGALIDADGADFQGKVQKVLQTHSQVGHDTWGPGVLMAGDSLCPQLGAPPRQVGLNGCITASQPFDEASQRACIPTC